MPTEVSFNLLMYKAQVLNKDKTFLVEKSVQNIKKIFDFFKKHVDIEMSQDELFH